MNNLSLTYKKIYNLFKGIAAAHPLIKDFNYGDIFDENKEVDVRSNLISLKLHSLIKEFCSEYKFHEVLNFQINQKVQDKSETN